MVIRKAVSPPIGRMAAFASVAVLMASAVEPSNAWAASLAPSPAGNGPAAVSAQSQIRSGATDFSARRRWGGGGAAAAAAFAGIVGTGLAIAAAQNRAAYGYYDEPYGGPGGPVYHGGGPYYYGGGPSYPYERYGGSSPYEHCGQGYMTNCW